jgi:hypothetical protein
MSKTATAEDPVEVVQMRETLAEFGRVVRKARESQSNMRALRVAKTEAPQPANDPKKVSAG